MSEFDTSKCNPISKVQVGEAGKVASIDHPSPEAITKRVVFQNDNTDLCGNMGVVALLVVSGQIKSQAVLTTSGDSIETTIGKGETVTAIAHTVLLPTDIVCGRLGNATLTLFDCGPAT
ncbi:MAG: hypothetical protein AAF732_17830 [Pseudomonadota bacterium]